MTHQPAIPREPRFSADLRFALELADIADAISLPRFKSADLRIDTKPDRTFVTDADIAVENAIRAHILMHNPNDGFFGEESGEVTGSNRRWILDPIDGTANFLRGVPNWATLIALEVDGVVTHGVVSAPCQGTRWWAENGGGAWRQDTATPPRQLQVSGVQKLEDASLSFQSIGQWRDAGYLDALLPLTESVWRDRAYGDMWSYMALAEGLLDVVTEHDVKAYDLAALVPIINEAGGRFTDVTGSAGVWNGSSLATNGYLHDAVVQLVAAHHRSQ